MKSKSYYVKDSVTNQYYAGVNKEELILTYNKSEAKVYTQSSAEAMAKKLNSKTLGGEPFEVVN